MTTNPHVTWSHAHINLYTHKCTLILYYETCLSSFSCPLPRRPNFITTVDDLDRTFWLFIKIRQMWLFDMNFIHQRQNIFWFIELPTDWESVLHVCVVCYFVFLMNIIPKIQNNFATLAMNTPSRSARQLTRYL